MTTPAMTTPANPSNPHRTRDDRNLVAIDEATAVTFEDKLHLFWRRNRTVVIGACVLAVAAILVKGGWDYMQRQKDQSVRKAYAAATTPEQLKSFSLAHADHPLGGVAQLQVADEAYQAGKSAEAIAGYEKAIAALKGDALAARAQLGRAVARIQAGKEAEATNELKQLANDANQFKAIRTEAAYHLMSLAVDSGNVADAQKYSEQLMQIDPGSPWTQRAMLLRASLPAQPAAPATPDATGSAPPAEQKQDEAAPRLELNLPGKK